MDDLANELSCTLIDADSSGRCSEGPIRTKEPSICGGEASAEGDGGQIASGSRLTRTLRDIDQLHISNNSSSRSVFEHKRDLSHITRRGSMSSLNAKSRPTRPVTRSASILLRSKVLILSDSESEDNEDNMASASVPATEPASIQDKIANVSSLKRRNVRKNRHKKTVADKKLLGSGNPFASSNQCSGKRKRSATISMSMSTDLSSSGHHHGQRVTDGQSAGPGDANMAMDCECFESSSLSETSDDEYHYDEADDEQSDFYEVMAKTGCSSSSSSANQLSPSSTRHHGRSKYTNHSLPLHKNPFALITASTSSTPSSSFNSSSSNVIWKRRKRNQWP
ncbi:hypothetical protein HDE_01988 [Halotydeus destructor]|nr:hypothetical protein HDE_01988 [Halotydeus destructor]